MTEQQAVMRQALEALEQIAGAMPFPVGRNAITALRQALQSGTDVEPATELRKQPAGESTAYKPPAKWTDAEIADGYRGIRWVTADGVYGRPTEEDVERYLGYTRPQPAAWVGLTDEEWQDLSDRYGMILFGRFKNEIEAKLEEKNT